MSEAGCSGARRQTRAGSAWASLWNLGPQALGGAATPAAGVYLGLTLLAGSGAVLRPDPARIAELQAVQQKRVLAQFLRERDILTAQQREKLVQLLLREQPPAQRERELHGS